MTHILKKMQMHLDRYPGKYDPILGIVMPPQIKDPQYKRGKLIGGTPVIQKAGQKMPDWNGTHSNEDMAKCCPFLIKQWQDAKIIRKKGCGKEGAFSG